MNENKPMTTETPAIEQPESETELIYGLMQMADNLLKKWHEARNVPKPVIELINSLVFANQLLYTRPEDWWAGKEQHKHELAATAGELAREIFEVRNLLTDC